MTSLNERDTTIAEIHKVRRRISDAFGGDIHAISEDARRRQEQSGRPTVSFADSAKERPSMINYRNAFEAITSDQRYLANLDWGDPRAGHPEGTVRAHIAEIEKNLDPLYPKLTDEDYWKLRLLIHTHDSFKGESQPSVPIAHPKSHASLARDFLAKYCDDPDLLSMVQLHDEPFALYRQVQSKGKYNQDRFNALLTSIYDWNLFLAFNIVDGCTTGKSRDPLHWLFREVAGKVESRFTESDIIDA